MIQGVQKTLPAKLRKQAVIADASAEECDNSDEEKKRKKMKTKTRSGAATW